MVFEVCRWLRTQYTRLYLTDGRQVRPSLRSVMCNKYIEGVCHFLPIDWSLDFFELLRDDLERWCNGGGSSSDRSTRPRLQYGEGAGLSKGDGEVAVRRLQYCIDTLRLPEVKMLYKSASERESERARLMQKAVLSNKAVRQSEPPSAPSARKKEDENDI